MTFTRPAALGLHLTHRSAFALVVGLDGVVQGHGTTPLSAHDVDAIAAAARQAASEAASSENHIISVGIAADPIMLPLVRNCASLTEALADTLHLRPQVGIAPVTHDLRAHVPGVGVAEPSTMVMVMGDEAGYLLNSRIEAEVPGIGATADAILSGYFGYEFGAGAPASAIHLLQHLPREQDMHHLCAQAATIAPGSNGVTFLGSHTGGGIDRDEAELRRMFRGLLPHHGSPHLARALMEAAAYWLREQVERLREAGVPCRRFVATGPIAQESRLLMQIHSDVLRERITIHPAKHPAAVGAAVLGVIAAGPNFSGFASNSMVMRAISRASADVPGREPLVIRPNRHAAAAYDPLYQRFCELRDTLG